MVVAGSPTGRQRNNAARALIEWGFQAFESKVLFPVGATLARARVQRGGLRHVDLVAPRPIRLALPRGHRPKVALKVRYEGPLRAPIVENQEVAQLLISFDGRPVGSVPLVARTSVASATPIQRVFNGLAGWLPWA